MIWIVLSVGFIGICLMTRSLKQTIDRIELDDESFRYGSAVDSEVE